MGLCLYIYHSVTPRKPTIYANTFYVIILIVQFAPDFKISRLLAWKWNWNWNKKLLILGDEMVAILASSFSGSSISISAFPELSNRENPLKLDGRISAILVLRKTGRKCEKLWMWLVEFFAICLLSERWVPEHLFPNHSIKILYPKHGIDEDILLTIIQYM